eukprot:220003_1
MSLFISKLFHQSNFILSIIFILIVILETRTPDVVNIELYSRGMEQEKINDIDTPVIKVNGTNRIVLNENENNRGMSIVIINEFTGLVNQSIGFDVHENGDDAMTAFLNTIKTNRIVAIVGYDQPSVSNDVLNILRSWGCNGIDSIGYRDAFIFIGSAVNISNWTYCEHSYRSGSAILKSFDIPLKLNIPLIFPYEMIKMTGSYVCDLLYNNFNIIYDIDYQSCIRKCLYKYDENECVMINYVLNGKTLSDSRCYIFVQICDLSQ